MRRWKRARSQTTLYSTRDLELFLLHPKQNSLMTVFSHLRLTTESHSAFWSVGNTSGSNHTNDPGREGTLTEILVQGHWEQLLAQKLLVYSMANFPIGWNFAYHPGEILKVLWSSAEPGGLRKSHTGTLAYPCMDELHFQTALQFLTCYLGQWHLSYYQLSRILFALLRKQWFWILLDLSYIRLAWLFSDGDSLLLSAPTQDTHASFTQKRKEESFGSLVGLWCLTEDRSWRDKEEVGTLWRPHWAAVWRPLPWEEQRFRTGHREV